MKKIHLSLIIIASLVLIGSITAGWIHLYANQNTVPENVQVSGWDVGGKKTTDVLKELDERLQQMGELPLNLSMTKQDVPEVKLTLAEAGVTYEAETFRNALLQLSAGSWWDKLNYRREFSQNWSLVPHFDPSVLKSMYNDTWEKEHFGIPVNATRRINDNDQIIYTTETSVARIDWQTFSEQMTAIIPKDFTPIDNRSTQALKLDLPIYTLQPKITYKGLKDEGIDRKIVQFSTTLGSSGPGRIYNVSSAAKAVDGMVLKPGDLFDYSKVIAKAEKESGFQEAPVIVNGKLVPGIGGGICQVSSTVYNAALRTGMEIVERRNHSLPVSYLPKGQDATFASGSINFRFKNNTGKTLIIRAAVQEHKLTVKFFGTFPENIEYALESNIVKTLPVTDKFVQNASIPTDGQEILQSGKPGYVVETYQTKIVDGKVIEKHKISTDTYRPQNRLIAVPPGSGRAKNNGPASNDSVVEDGVSGPNL